MFFLSSEIDTLVQQAFYIIFGLTSILSNSVIILTIFLNRHLHRKSYGLIVGVCFGDILTSSGLFCLGLFRLRLLIAGQKFEQQTSTTTWQCLSRIPIFLSILGPQSTVFLIFLASLDRFVAATASTPWYEGYGKRYIFLIFACFGFGFVSYAWSFYALTLKGEENLAIDSICSFHETFPSGMLIFYYVTQMFVGWISSITIGGAVFFAKWKPEASGSTKNQFWQQHQITFSLALTIFSSLLLWFVPATILSLGYATRNSDRRNLSAFSPYLWMLIELRSTLNMFIYFWRDKAMRDGAQSRIFGEQLSVQDQRRYQMQGEKLISYQHDDETSRKKSNIEYCRRKSETIYFARIQEEMDE